MLSDYLTRGLAHLRQPRLIHPVCENMLAKGLLRPDVLDGVDGLLCEDAVAEIMAWPMPEGLPVGTDKQDRWRTVSSLQKAIRFGDVKAAMDAAHAAYGMDPHYLLRRLVICALEDVGLGNLYAVAVTLALAGDRASRRMAGEQKTVVWLAAQLASGWKDRTLANLAVAVDLDRAAHALTAQWSRLSNPELAARAQHMMFPPERRMLAAWLLAGTKQFPGMNMPADNDRPRTELMRLMAASGMPLILYWMADRAAIRGGGCMAVSFLPLWQVLQANGDREIEFRTNEQPHPRLLGTLLSAAYDMHTREGQAAIRRLSTEPRLRGALAMVPEEDRLTALFEAVFAVEGGLLNMRVSLPELDRLHFATRRAVFAYYGLPEPDRQTALMQAAELGLPRLHMHRYGALREARRALDFPSSTAPSRARATTPPAQPFLPPLTASQPPLGHTPRATPDRP